MCELLEALPAQQGQGVCGGLHYDTKIVWEVIFGPNFVLLFRFGASLVHTAACVSLQLRLRMWLCGGGAPGRVSEELNFGRITTGAADDLDKVA